MMKKMRLGPGYGLQDGWLIRAEVVSRSLHVSSLALSCSCPKFNFNMRKPLLCLTFSLSRARVAPRYATQC